MAASPTLHALLLLSDSALPLGSFAFSSGLESFLAHRKQQSEPSPSHKTTPSGLQAFSDFLSHSLQNLATTALPYVRYSHSALSRHSKAADQDACLEELQDLDNAFDASTPCTVARRASISQGRALLAIWTRALSVSCTSSSLATALSMFATLSSQKMPKAEPWEQLHAHFPPLFGAVGSALQLSADETSYLFLFSHAKAVLSAAVRASVMGPYQSQAVLASSVLQTQIRALSEDFKDVMAEDAAVSVPTMDLWMGRHELLYSRIFNS